MNMTREQIVNIDRTNQSMNMTREQILEAGYGDEDSGDEVENLANS